jgi:hypothetical protein
MFVPILQRSGRDWSRRSYPGRLTGKPDVGISSISASMTSDPPLKWLYRMLPTRTSKHPLILASVSRGSRASTEALAKTVSSISLFMVAQIEGPNDSISVSGAFLTGLRVPDLKTNLFCTERRKDSARRGLLPCVYSTSVSRGMNLRSLPRLSTLYEGSGALLSARTGFVANDDPRNRCNALLMSRVERVNRI